MRSITASFGLLVSIAILMTACGRSALDPTPFGADAGTPDGGGACTVDADCDDGMVCNGDEVCRGGSCAPGIPPVCDDGVACTVDRCDEASGGCLSFPDNTRCDPGQVCRAGSGCETIRCGTDADCTDGIFCNGQEQCEGRICTGGPLPSCDDGDPCSADLCDVGLDRCTNPPADEDDDGFGPVGCGGGDCDDTNPEVRPDAEERCSDGIDNDCDMQIDCVDGECTGRPECRCAPVEDCAGARDADCDGFVGCNDPDCMGSPLCCASSEICGNGMDDDCNGLTDCADRACAMDPSCACGPVEVCGNTRDDDCNGLIDCADPACRPLPECRCGPVEICGNGLDDDCNGFADCADGACAMLPECRCGPIEICGNFVDDDCNGVTDCADPACAGDPSCPCGPVEICGNLRDDDCNGVTDCADPACAPLPECMCQPFELCSGGIDDDCDMLTDCADPDCVMAPECVTSCMSVTDLGSAVGTPVARGSTRGRPNTLVPSCRSSSTAGEQVFRWTAPTSGTWTINTNGATYDTVLMVQNTCGGPDIACDDDSGTGLDSQVVLRLRAGQRIFIVVDGFGGSEGDFVLNIVRGGPMEICDNFVDDDGDGLRDCMDPDCATDPRCCMPVPEVCTDGADQDCDSLVDCADPDCSGSPACCVPTPEVCDNARDDDCDFRIDCGDPDCATSPLCCVPVPEICDDGVDQDCDTLVDCADPDCTGVPACCMPAPEICFDGRDNDCDTRVDCADSDCMGTPACCVPTAEVCTDGADNDCDMAIDCADPDCALDPACAPTCPDRDIGSRSGGIVATGSTVGQGDDFAPSCGPMGSAPDVSFTWTAPVTGRYFVTTAGSGFDTVLTRLSTCAGPEVQCNDDAGMLTTTSFFQFFAIAGQRSIFVIDGAGSAAGSYQLIIFDM